MTPNWLKLWQTKFVRSMVRREPARSTWKHFRPGMETLENRRLLTAPVALDDSFALDEDSQLVQSAPGVLVNDSDPEGNPIIAILGEGPRHGTLDLSNEGSFTYTPSADYSGTDSFTYFVIDTVEGLSSNVAIVTLTINPVNDAPTAQDGSLTTEEDTAAGGTLSASDVDGDPVTYSILGQPANGMVTLDGNSFTYTPNANFHGSDSFTWQTSDGQGGTATATVSITVNSVNDTPVAQDGSLTTDEDTPASGTLDASDAEGDGLIFAISGDPQHGSVVLNGNSFTYTPNADYHGGDSFTYQVSDGNSTSTATVNITVNPVNDAPTAQDSAVITEEDTALNGTLAGVDVDNDPLTFSITVNPQHGTLTLDGSSYTYTPNADFHGSDSFTWQVEDGLGGTATATVSITVNSVNDAPTAPDTSVSTDEDTPATGTLDASDVEGDMLSYLVTVQPQHGSVAISGNGFTYTPNANFNGSDSFTWQATDGQGGFVSATVSITVNAINDDPTAQDGSLTTNEETPATGTLDASDSDNDPLTYSVTVNPQHGTLTLDGSSYTYTPNTDFHGSDSFTFEVSDGQGGAASATVSITVQPLNDAPTAQDGSLTTDEDMPAGGTLDASDPDGDMLSYNVTVQPQNGSVVLNGNGFTYTPNADFHGSDAFTWEANDGQGGTATATVSITVNSVNDTPTAQDTSISTDEDAPASGTLDASDGDNDPLTFSITVNPVNGSVVLDANGFTYTPNAGYHGADSFAWQVSDGQGGTATGTVSITVNDLNNTPTAQDGSLSTDEDTAGSGTLDATDSDGGTLTFSITANPQHGTVVLDGSSYTYTPHADFHGSDSFTWQVDDGQGGTASATVSITVTTVNDAPTAPDSSLTTPESTVLTGTLDGSDVDGDTLSFSITVNPEHGSVVLDGNGFTYTPDAGFHGADSFAWEVSDGQGGTATATVSITVSEHNDAPTAQDGTLTTEEDIFGTGTLDAADINNDPLTYSILVNPQHGSVALDGNSYTYSPSANFSGSDSFTWQVSDGRGGTATATVTVTVTAVNDAPTAQNSALTVEQDSPGNGTLAATDAEGDTLIFSITVQPQHGTVVLDGSGYTYTPDAGFHGSDSITWQVDDGNGGQAAATVSITVTAANNAPTAQDSSLTTSEDTAVGGTLSAADADNDPLTYSITVQAQHGTVVRTGSSFTYTPAADFHGSDSFTWQVSDGNGGTATATVSITVTAVNDVPTAADLSAATDEDTDVEIDVLAEAGDPDGDALTIQVLSSTHGTAVVDDHGTPQDTSDDTVIFTPAANFSGQASFTYQVSDGTTSSATATVTITVTAMPDRILVTGAGVGAQPRVQVYYADTREEMFSFLAFGAGFRGGVRVAAGDVDGDGFQDIIAAGGAGGQPRIRVFSGTDGSVLQDFLAHGAGFRGGLWVAAGDVDGDSLADMVVGLGTGSAPRVKVFSGADGSVLRNFLAYGSAFKGGVRVAAGDVDGDTLADIITAPGAGSGPRVKVFSGADGSVLQSFLAYGAGYKQGIHLAAGDVDEDGFADIITGPANGMGPTVRVFSGADGGLLNSFLAYGAGFRRGVAVGAADVDGDGVAEVFTGPGPGIGPEVKVFNGLTADLMDSFFAADNTFRNGLSVAGG